MSFRRSLLIEELKIMIRLILFLSQSPFLQLLSFASVKMLLLFFKNRELMYFLVDWKIATQPSQGKTWGVSSVDEERQTSE